MSLTSEEIIFEGQNAQFHTQQQGMVIRKNRGLYWVQVGSRSIPCTISNRLRKKLIYPTAAPWSRHHRVDAVGGIEEVDPVAIGDQVLYAGAGDGNGHITEVLPRKNQLSRRAAGFKPLEQVLVANVDQVVAVFSAARPEPKWGLLDRYLVQVEAFGLPALICITKLDLVEKDSLRETLDIYRQLGYRVVLTSAVTGEGIEQIRQELSDRLSIFIGKSGVGKTSLLNVIEPGLGARIGEVSKESGKGKHTTTHLELYPLACGGGVVDTPGLREFTLWEIDREELAYCFPEMRPYLGKCKFGADCTHVSEPGCAVHEAVCKGKITDMRYQSYLKLLP